MKIFLSTSGLIENTELIEIVLRGFCLFPFPNFIFGFHGFHLKKLKVILYDFRIGAGRKFSGE
mgnify:CR=1 FL=1